VTSQEAEQRALTAYRSAHSIGRQLSVLETRGASWLDVLERRITSGIDVAHFDRQLKDVERAVKQHGRHVFEVPGADTVSVEGAAALLSDVLAHARRLGVPGR
jgi:hypothetical protein